MSSRLVFAMTALAMAACPHSNDTPASTGQDGGTADSNSPPSADGGSGLRAFTPPTDPGGGGILFAASGEVLALTGYSFPPASPDDPAFVDGWEVRFTHLLSTIDKITLSENPDTVPGDQSKTGTSAAEVNGPWAVDLARSDPNYLAGKGGPGEQAVPIAVLSKQKDGSPFKTDGTRYAFGFDAVSASPTAYNVNLDSSALVDYREMVKDQCVVLYVGTATFKGNKADATCYPDDRKSFPDTVDFRLCFKSPATYQNCQNPDNDPAQAFPDEEHQRGIAFKSNQSVIGQVTFHVDHPFWDSVLHDAPTHFDPFAARAVGQDGGKAAVTLEMTKGADYTDYTDALGRQLTWRYCVEPPTDVHPKLTGAMRFDPQTVPHATASDPGTGLRDYYDFATYNQSTQGHLNSDGLCFVKRNYPSPP